MRTLVPTSLAALAFAALAAVLPASQAQAIPTDGDNILVYGNYSSAVSTAVSRLQGLGHTVTSGTTLPGDITSYDTVYFVGISAAENAAQEQQLVDFVEAGGGLYLQGERACCETANEFAERIVKDLLAEPDQLVTIGGLGDINGPFSYNTDAFGGHMAGVSDLVTNQQGGISWTGDADNIYMSGSPAYAIVAGWSGADFTAGTGSVIVSMDINWILNSNSAEHFNAFQTAMTEGWNTVVAPPPSSEVPLPAAAPLLLAGLGALGVARRRRRAA
ncbi:MAG: VPLPA-CTERM sorting domain-containing protein [Pseudomonadota bacterium]|nr:VPLPA-CTERM sorting domain-containing protein [Pseudomonadota bacterium]